MERLADSTDLLGECPLWDGEALWWTDIHGRALRRFGTRLETFPLPEPAGSFALREGGGLLLAMRSGMYSFSVTKLTLHVKADLRGARFNDGRCDRAGRFWVGTMDDATMAASGALYRLEEMNLERKKQGVAIANSLAFSPDGRTMYFADSLRRTIWAYDYDPASGEPSNERVFATTAQGVPDGSCVDADGCLWNAEYGGWRIVRYTPQGKIDREIRLPVQQPTCCAFGGPGLDRLYVTTASQKLNPGQLAAQPLAGAVLVLDPRARGLPEARFAG